MSGNKLSLLDAGEYVGAVESAFVFDAVHDTDASQGAIYEAVGAPVVRKVLAGYNATIFAYGQTGSGKTHTMSGSRDGDAGIIPRVVTALFESDELRSGRGKLTISVLEIYCEKMRDLLAPGAAHHAGGAHHDDEEEDHPHGHGGEEEEEDAETTASRASSRPGSRPGSRAPSRPGSRPGSRSGSPVPAALQWAGSQGPPPPQQQHYWWGAAPLLPAPRCARAPRRAPRPACGPAPRSARPRGRPG